MAKRERHTTMNVYEELHKDPASCQEHIVKLPLISASVVAYILLAATWICYVDLVALH
jgi:hypothetical protein